MKYVLDSNAASELMKGNIHVRARLEKASQSMVAIPQPALAEIAFGIQRLPASKRRRVLERRFAAMLAEIKRAEWSDSVTEAFGRIKATLQRRGVPIEDFDVAIAAHAIANSAVLVTANTSDMARVPGIQLEDWSRF